MPTTQNTKKRRTSKEMLIDKIEKSIRTIAAERDKLRALISEVNDICGDCDEAVSDLEYAVASLSKLL